jgi:hypothetical protein
MPDNREVLDGFTFFFMSQKQTVSATNKHATKLRDALRGQRPNTSSCYLKRAREIIGDQTPAEIEYDNTVIARLARGMDIQSAIDAANKEHPDEALQPKPNQWENLAARYDYLLQHNEFLKQSGIKE